MCGRDNSTKVDLRLRLSFRASLELFSERDIIEEDPWIVEFAVPGAFQIANRGNQLVHFFISYQRNERGVRTCRVGAIGGIVSIGYTP